MKIQKISVKNFKAISEQEMEFNGCSAIVTAGNNKGKTTLLRGLIDRFRSEKPEIVVKQGEQKGHSTMELTDGSVIEWKFTDKSESFSMTTKDGIKQTAGVLSGIGERYFGKRFDIDKFLNSGPKSQIKALQELVGLDFTDIDNRYRTAYEVRTEANREVKRLRALNVPKPEKVEKPDIEALKVKFQDAKKFNEAQKKKFDQKDELFRIMGSISDMLGDTIFQELFQFAEANKLVQSIEIEEDKNIDLIEDEIFESNKQLRKFDSYERDLKTYQDWIKGGKEANAAAEKSDKKVSGIETEKKKMIAGADVPGDFDITEDGILYKGLPLTDSQISSSGKYIAALKLGSMVLGEVKSLHFDASSLDKNSLAEIQKWAIKNDLQLMIERPDFQGGDFKYEIVE